MVIVRTGLDLLLIGVLDEIESRMVEIFPRSYSDNITNLRILNFNIHLLTMIMMYVNQTRSKPYVSRDVYERLFRIGGAVAAMGAGL